MPGALIAADYQLELRGLLTGADTVYQFGPAGITGLGVPPAKTADSPLDGQDGAYGSPDYMGVRTLLVNYEISHTSAYNAFGSFETLSTAWGPSTTDIELHLRLPGWGHIYYVGRPRGLDDNLADVKSGVIVAVGEFHCLDPRSHAYIPPGS